MKKTVRVLLLSLLLIGVLTGCGRSVEKDIQGAWEIIDDGPTGRYVEFGNDRMIVREGLESEPQIAEFRMTDLQKGKFIIDIAEPGTGTYQFFIEGKFEKGNKIMVSKAMDSGNRTFELWKVKDLDKKMEQAKEDQAKQDELDEQEREKEAKEQAKLDKEQAEQDKLQAQKDQEQAEQEEREREKAEKAAQAEEERAAKEQADAQNKQPSTQDASSNNGTTNYYVQKANHLEERIIAEARKAYPNDQDMRPGFYGQYYDDWDHLLNELWGTLKETLPANQFEQLKAEQRQWIAKKESNFTDYSDETASTRAMGMDYLATETAERVNYLIQSYMD